MAYNFKLKKYANGSCQLIYYHNPVICKDDLKYDLPQFEAPEIFSDESFENLWTPWGEAKEIVDEFLCEKEKVFLSPEDIKRKEERSKSVSYNRTKNKIYDICRNNVWDWFFTFTFNENAVSDKTDYDECSKKVCNWFKNIRKRKCPDMKYIIVPELHESGCWHFHALVSNVDNLDFKIAINQQEYRKNKDGSVKINKKGQPVRNKYFGKELRTSYPDGDFVYNILNYNIDTYGFSTATRIKDTRRASSYICKYITKELSGATFGKRRYYPSRNLTLPDVNVLMYDRDSLNDLIDFISSKYHVKMNYEITKTKKFNVDGFENCVSYFEFG